MGEEIFLSSFIPKFKINIIIPFSGNLTLKVKVKNLQNAYIIATTQINVLPNHPQISKNSTEFVNTMKQSIKLVAKFWPQLT